MNKYIKISKYHYFIIFLYLISTPILWLLDPKVFEYQYTNKNINLIIPIIIFSIIGFCFYVYMFKNKEIKIDLNNLFKKIPLLVLYALFFAIPEEIIFRGIIQENIYSYFLNTNLAIFLSSLIFGAIHLPNGARGLSPVKWNWQFAIISFLGGIIFGTIFALSNSLLISTLLHAFFLFWLINKAVK